MLVSAACNSEGSLLHPAGNYWEKVGEMHRRRKNPHAFVLPDGRVFFAGGNLGSLGTTEIYDPKTRQFTLGPTSPYERIFDAAALLPDGRVLLVGGGGRKRVGPELVNMKDSDEVPWTGEVIDPVKMTIEPLERLPLKLIDPRVFVMRQELVLVTGKQGYSPDRIHAIYTSSILAVNPDTGKATVALTFPQGIVASAIHRLDAHKAWVFASRELPEIDPSPQALSYHKKQYLLYEMNLDDYSLRPLPFSRENASDMWLDGRIEASSGKLFKIVPILTDDRYCKLYKGETNYCGCYTRPNYTDYPAEVWAQDRYILFIQPTDTSVEKGSSILSSLSNVCLSPSDVGVGLGSRILKNAFLVDITTMLTHDIGMPHHPRHSAAIIPLTDGTVLLAAGEGFGPSDDPAYQAELFRLDRFRKDLKH